MKVLILLLRLLSIILLRLGIIIIQHLAADIPVAPRHPEVIFFHPGCELLIDLVLDGEDCRPETAEVDGFGADGG